MPTFSFVKAPAILADHLLGRYNAPLPLHTIKYEIHSFGNMFMPDYYPCQTARLVSCYALFK